MGIVLVLIGQALQQDVASGTSACGVGQVSNLTSLHCRPYNSSSKARTGDQFPPMDFTYPMMLYIVVGFLCLLAMVVLFRPRYKRLEMERRATEILSRLQEEGDTPASSIASLPNTSKRITKEATFKLNPNQRPDQSSTKF